MRSCADANVIKGLVEVGQTQVGLLLEHPVDVNANLTVAEWFLGRYVNDHDRMPVFVGVCRVQIGIVGRRLVGKVDARVGARLLRRVKVQFA